LSRNLRHRRANLFLIGDVRVYEHASVPRPA
jgi:hypothetical protein